MSSASVCLISMKVTTNGCSLESLRTIGQLEEIEPCQPRLKLNLKDKNAFPGKQITKPTTNWAKIYVNSQRKIHKRCLISRWQEHRFVYKYGYPCACFSLVGCEVYYPTDHALTFWDLPFVYLQLWSNAAK